MHHLLVLVLHVLTGVTVVLVTPVTLVQHVRDAILALVDRPAWHAQIRMGVYFALALFSASFLNSYMSISNLFRAAAIVSSANSHHHHGADGHGGGHGGHGADLAVAAGASDLHEHLVEAERDNILSTAVLLITALAASFAQLLREHQRLSVRFVAMEKQASNASAAYMATLKSDTSATSTPAPKTTSSSSNSNNGNNGKSTAGDSADANTAAITAALETAQTDLIAARAQIKQLQEEALKARQTADARVQAIKSQAENAQNEYERALSENARLKSQIKDYDVVFSGDRKKD